MRSTLVIAVLLLASQATAQQLPREILDHLDRQLELMNKQAPIEINPLQKLVQVSRHGGVVLYSIETAVPQEQWTQEMRARPLRESLPVMCSGETRVLLDHGFQLRYLITDKGGLYVTSFVISRDKCLN